ncbi:hypothetical protein CF336_g4053 [Tilletia laevis]|uniref:Uncharacterized protein n=2 Tax=Tilletia caries TaxID=13290 RepID=A0A177UKJ4_9BASI|nr:hypothetical protein CF336_g4053 [Tilletia laevis]KAE8202943.1 hypothetical protein CF335_g3219 [Tilletia laevis]KAE8261315.1 hypothetical protein A4X03_0g3364 [Tilletia caries]
MATSASSLRPPLPIKQASSSSSASASASASTSSSGDPSQATPSPTRSKSLRHRLSFRRPKQSDVQGQGEHSPSEAVPPLPSPLHQQSLPPPAATPGPSPKDSRSLLSPLRRSFSRSRLAVSHSAPGSAATSPNASTSDLSVSTGAYTPRASSSSAVSSPTSPFPNDSVSTPRRADSRALSPAESSPASPAPARTLHRLRSLSFSRKRPTVDTSRQSLDQSDLSPVAGSSTFSPSSEAPPVPVLSSAYMHFRSPVSTLTSPSSTADSPMAPSKALKAPKPSHSVQTNLTMRAAEVSPPSSSLSTASSQSTSSFTSRSSSFSTNASSYPVSPAVSALDHALPISRKIVAPSTTPVVSATPTRQPQQDKPALQRHTSASTASPVQRQAPTRKGTKDTKASESPTTTLASLEPATPLSASKSFKATFKRKVFGRSASSTTATEPPTPDLVGDSSTSTLDSADDPTSTPPSQPSPLRAVDPILTGTGKLDFFDSIKNLPSEDGHGAATAAFLASRNNNQAGGAVQKQGLSSIQTASALGVSNLGPGPTMPLAPSPILLSPKKATLNRALSEEPESLVASSSLAFPTHRRSAPSDGSMELGSDLLMAVMSVQALDKEREKAAAAAARYGRSSTLDSFESSSLNHGRPSMAQTMRTLPPSMSESPESLSMHLPPITAGRPSLQYGGFSPPRGAASSLYGPASSHGHGSSRRFLTEAQMRDLDQQTALYAERVRQERRPMPVHRPGLFATAVRDEEDSEDDYGADEDEEEQRSRQRAAKSRAGPGRSAAGKGSTPAALLLNVNTANLEPVSPTSGSILFPSTITQGKMKRSKDSKKDDRRAGSPWDVSSDEEDARPVVRTPEPGLDLPAKRALYTCTLLKIHPHLAPHFLVPGNPTAQPLAAVALAAKSSDSDAPNPPTEVRFPRSTNGATFLAGHASTTSLIRGGLRIALARAQVMRALKRRKLPLVEEVEISWFQRKYGSELVAPDRVMAEMGRRPQASPEALMKPPVASESGENGVSAQVDEAANPMKSWAQRGRFAERMRDWKPLEGQGGSAEDSVEAQSVLAHFLVQSPDFRMVPKPPALLLSARVCALAGVPKPSWIPPTAPPKRFRSREIAARNAGLSRSASLIGAPWLAPRVSASPTSSAPVSPSAESDSSASMLAAPDAGQRRDSSLLTAGNAARPASTASASSASPSPSSSSPSSDAFLMRHLKQSLPPSLTQNVITEEEVLQDSDEEDLPLALLQSHRRDQQRRTYEAQFRQREAERRREEQDRRTLERNRAMLADARERRAKGDVRASVLQAHDYGAGDASTAALGPSEQQKETKGRGRQSSSETALAPSLPRRSSFMHDDNRSVDADPRSSRLYPAHEVTPMRSVSAVNLRASYIEGPSSAKSGRRLSKMPSSASFGANVLTTPVAASGSSQNLLSPPAPASIRQRSPDRSSTMPTSAELARGVSMGGLAPLQASRSGVLATPPSWSAGGHRASGMPHGNGVSAHALPLATPPSPYTQQQQQQHLQPPSRTNSGPAKAGSSAAHDRMMAAMSYNGPASSHGQGMGPSSSPGVSPGRQATGAGGFPFQSSASVHGHGGGGMNQAQGMYMMNPQQQQQHMSMYYGANLQALQYQQAMAAGYMRPTSTFMGQQPYPAQPLVALDSRNFPASATVLRRS